MQKYLKYWLYGSAGLSIILIMALVISLSNRPKVPDNIRDYKLQHTVDSLNAVIQDNAIERNKLGLQIDSLNESIEQIKTSIAKKQKEIQQLRDDYEETIDRVNGFTDNDINSYFTNRYHQ
jgi:septal ring factor EnvC (AmiA/AmiB activator)